MIAAAIGLGGNIGDTRATMSAALDRLGERPGIAVEAVSSLYETPPWGKTDQPVFLNAAARLLTGGTAQMLLADVLAVEAELGRHRAELWGPRNIDIDILLFGNEVVDAPGLRIPHPRLTERAFALVPLAEVMPDSRIGGRRVVDWLTQIETAGIFPIAGPEWYQAAASVEP